MTAGAVKRPLVVSGEVWSLTPEAARSAIDDAVSSEENIPVSVDLKTELWTAESSDPKACHGADALVIEGAAKWLLTVSGEALSLIPEVVSPENDD